MKFNFNDKTKVNIIFVCLLITLSYFAYTSYTANKNDSIYMNKCEQLCIDYFNSISDATRK